MPINPKGGESKNDFISRCMSTEKDKFPEQKQRLAVCHTAWRGKAMKSQYNQVQKCVEEVEKKLIGKAEEGDIKMIFGKPFEFKGGDWVQSGAGAKTDDVPDVVEPAEDEERQQYLDDALDVANMEGMNITMEDLAGLSDDQLVDITMEDFSSLKSDVVEPEDDDELFDKENRRDMESDLLNNQNFIEDISTQMDLDPDDDLELIEELVNDLLDDELKELAGKFGSEPEEGISEITKSDYQSIQKNLVGIKNALKEK